ncbi:hypothetical protein [Klebsiella pneumoniae]|uniref:hypothetical protein n=1 Tax=Klebsiella pneumoniae TaxID=573 RepID=UPI00130E77CF|nr:hypothetical protein [Klebsiella pneumoniae]
MVSQIPLGNDAGEFPLIRSQAFFKPQSSSSALPRISLRNAFALQFVEWLLQLMELDRVDKLDVALVQHLV